jgi:ribosomal protein S10
MKQIKLNDYERTVHKRRIETLFCILSANQIEANQMKQIKLNDYERTVHKRRIETLFCILSMKVVYYFNTSLAVVS